MQPLTPDDIVEGIEGVINCELQTTLRFGECLAKATLLCPGHHLVVLADLHKMSKDEAADKMRDAAVAYGAQALIFASEAWSKTFAIDEPPKASLEDEPDRREVLLFSVSLPGRSMIVQYPLIRDEGGVLMGYGPRTEMLVDGGRFTHLL